MQPAIGLSVNAYQSLVPTVVRTVEEELKYSGAWWKYSIFIHGQFADFLSLTCLFLPQVFTCRAPSSIEELLRLGEDSHRCLHTQEYRS